MLRIKHVFATLLLGTFAIGLGAGCMELSTAPVSPPQVASEVSGQSAQSAQPAGLIDGLLGGLLRLVFRVLNIVGSIGGSLSNGRWRVDVPAGAFDGTATVKIGVASSSSADCQLEIWPADKNHFSTPVRLTANCSGISSDQLKDYIIFWFDPASRTWVPVEGSTVDLNRKTVSAPLQHFSTYKVGKAGW